MSASADDDARVDPGAIEVGPRPQRDVLSAARSDGGTDARPGAGVSDGRRALGLLLVALAGVVLFIGGGLLYYEAARLTARLPPAQLAQVVEAARGSLRIAAYAMMGGGFIALVGWRMLVAVKRPSRR